MESAELRPQQGGDPYLAQHVRLVTRDLDEAREKVSRMWERHRSELKFGRQYFLRWHQVERGPVSLSYGRTSNVLSIVCGPVSDSFRITLHEKGRINRRINGRNVVSSVKTGALYVPGQELELQTEPFSLLILTLDGRFVRQALDQRFERLPSAEDWPCEFPLTTPQGKALKALTRWTALELSRPNAEIVQSEGAWAHVQHMLLTLFLDCVDTPSLIANPRGLDLNEARVRRIEEWVEAHVSEPITVEDLARVVQVSVRSVQAAFQRLRGCTPMQMVMRQRLEAANLMLRCGGPVTRITDVATACGFFNFGRFATRYREVFGETPSQTRARRTA